MNHHIRYVMLKLMLLEIEGGEGRRGGVKCAPTSKYWLRHWAFRPAGVTVYTTKLKFWNNKPQVHSRMPISAFWGVEGWVVIQTFFRRFVAPRDEVWPGKAHYMCSLACEIPSWLARDKGHLKFRMYSWQFCRFCNDSVMFMIKVRYFIVTS